MYIFVFVKMLGMLGLFIKWFFKWFGVVMIIWGFCIRVLVCVVIFIFLIIIVFCKFILEFKVLNWLEIWNVNFCVGVNISVKILYGFLVNFCRIGSVNVVVFLLLVCVKLKIFFLVRICGIYFCCIKVGCFILSFLYVCIS